MNLAREERDRRRVGPSYGWCWNVQTKSCDKSGSCPDAGEELLKGIISENLKDPRFKAVVPGPEPEEPPVEDNCPESLGRKPAALSLTGGIRGRSSSAPCPNRDPAPGTVAANQAGPEQVEDWKLYTGVSMLALGGLYFFYAESASFWLRR